MGRTTFLISMFWSSYSLGTIRFGFLHPKSLQSLIIHGVHMSKFRVNVEEATGNNSEVFRSPEIAPINEKGVFWGFIRSRNRMPIQAPHTSPESYIPHYIQSPEAESSLQRLRKGGMSLLIYNIFLEDLKCLISDQNSEQEGGNKAHKHSEGIGSNIPKKEKMRNNRREGGGP
ncbi:hypothetical protein F5146DRAFT_1004344 [Armillaria mellea]|nr:hypothetical protein F5146DRAFT_1004344 [Armillaria mellea]